jgi:hypothetical protein
MIMLSPESAPHRMFNLIRGKNVCRQPPNAYSPYAQSRYRALFRTARDQRVICRKATLADADEQWFSSFLLVRLSAS